MKRVGYVYEKFFTRENIELAIKNATRNKKNRKIVRKVLNHKEEIINFIQNNHQFLKKYMPLINMANIREVIRRSTLCKSSMMLKAH